MDSITDTLLEPISKAVSIGSASPHEITLVEPTIDQMWIKEYPLKLMGDKTYDSVPLDERLYNEKHKEKRLDRIPG